MSYYNKSTIFGDISTEEFLADYWQKKPLVVRGAFTDFEMPFTAEELAGLACDTDAPSRIIIEQALPPENKPWQVKHSPFTDEDFTTLPDTHCTFLVNDLERYIPELGNLIEPFRFIPDWRIDDLMVSFAEDKGSVGPHNDDYDVFLIQGKGKRRWNIITREEYPSELMPDLPIALLKEFEADEEYVLDTGDMLYLPPNMPHYGIAEGPCFTFSVGFRAPRSVDLVQNWLETFSHNKVFQQRFNDAGRKLQQSSGEICKDDLDALSGLVINAIEKQQKNIKLFLGKHLTENKGEVPQQALAEVTQEHIQSNDFERESWLRMAYTEENGIINFFANGHHIELTRDKKSVIQELCENYYYTADSLKPLIADEKFRVLLITLISEGGIFLAE
ncbi:MAG: cupin domain-containing protein [Cocleimonas sp.]